MIVQGVAYTIMFVAVDAASPTQRLSTAITWASGDTVITKPGGSPTNTTNTPVHLGGGRYSLTLTAAETGLGLAVGATGQLLVDIAKTGVMVPYLGIVYDVTTVAPGSLTTTERTAVASSVMAQTIDGTALSALMAVVRSALLGKGTFPMTPAGGAFATRDAGDTKNRWAGTIGADGARTVTTFDGT